MKIGFAAASFALFAGHASIAQAQDDCTPIRFAAGRASAVVQGSAPAADTVCYRFTAAAGQTAMLKVVSGRNVIFAIDDLVDAQDNYRFSTQARTYTIRVGQMFRSVTPQRFSLSLAISGERGANAATAHSEGTSEWSVRPLPGASGAPGSVGFGGRTNGIDFFGVYGGCGNTAGHAISFGLDGYRGSALRRVQGLKQAVTFSAVDSRGTTRRHDGAMLFFGSELVLDGVLPPGFVAAMARSDRLIITTASGTTLATIALADLSRVQAAMKRVCRD